MVASGMRESERKIGVVGEATARFHSRCGGRVGGRECDIMATGLLENTINYSQIYW
jgi:hypothetical protein